MANNWLTVLMIIVNHCGVFAHTHSAINKCREAELLCVKRGVLNAPKETAENVIDTCLNDENSYAKLMVDNIQPAPKEVSDVHEKQDSKESVKK